MTTSTSSPFSGRPRKLPSTWSGSINPSRSCAELSPFRMEISNNSVFWADYSYSTVYRIEYCAAMNDWSDITAGAH